ncbi:MAG: TPR end-of-group domain-containing protein [Sphingosinicella sp.]|uniref:TPR end-of-group domain-containing protein n=1 Tax=Sphingosinicella sp. TaxID=1917971 RepID=UPI004037B52A
MASSGGNGAAAKRLKSWKEIASFFGTDERTVRRWEERGLPVHRVPGGARATIYADAGELERWFSGRKEEPSPASQPTAPRRRWLALAAVLAVLAGVASFIFVRDADPAPTATAAPRHEPPQRAVDLYTAATYQAERATPDSLRRALGLYGQAIAEDPAYAAAHAGLASAYIRLRVFSAMTEAEAYPRARAAAERALELDPSLAQAHIAMGFVTFYSDWDFTRGLHHFGEAARLDPRGASGRYQYGLALLRAGDFAAALRELDVAQRLDPRSRGILADRGFVLYLMGRREEGLALIRQVTADDPDYMLPHHYLSLIHLGEGNWRAGLDEAEIAARLRQDQGRLALAGPARRALEQGGGPAMLRVVLAGQTRRHAAGQEPAYVVAEFHALLGEREAALRYLRRSITAREAVALTMRFDPLLRNLHGDPEFRQLAARVGRPN